MASPALHASERALLQALQEIRAEIVRQDQGGIAPVVPDDLMSASDVAKELGKSKDTARRIIRKAGGSKMGGQLAIRRDDLRRALKAG